MNVFTYNQLMIKDYSLLNSKFAIDMQHGHMRVKNKLCDSLNDDVQDQEGLMMGGMNNMDNI